MAESDEAGNIIVARYDYEPYGASIGQGPQDAPAYTGHVSDSATGLTYMQQRYYDPEVGAFLSVDPVTAHERGPEQFGRYRYANGNPYGNIDPDGRKACGQNTTCQLDQGAAGSVIRGASQVDSRDSQLAGSIGAKAVAEAAGRTQSLRMREFKTAGLAARAWFDAIRPVALKYNSELGARIFTGLNQGAVMGNTVSDGRVDSIMISTLNTSVSGLGEGYPVVGYAHTHPGTNYLSGRDVEAGQWMRDSRTKRDFTVFVGLSDGRLYGWSLDEKVYSQY